MLEPIDPRRTIVSVWRRAVGTDGEFLGSGAFVSPRHVLTAKHVVENKQAREVTLGLVAGQHAVPVSRLHVHEQLDIAVIELERDFKDQDLVRLDCQSSSLEGATVDLYGVNPDTLNRDQCKGYTLGTWDARSGEYLFDHAQRKGFSGGIAVLDGHAIGVISKRHRTEQQGVMVPLYLAKEWLESILPQDTLAYISGRPRERTRRAQQTQNKFTQRVRQETKELLGQEKLVPLKAALLNQLPEASRQGAKPEGVLIPLDAPFSIESSIRALRTATEKCLKQLRDNNPKAVPNIVSDVTTVLGWLVLLAVSEDWLQNNAQQSAPLFKAQYIQIPIKTETSTEVVIARLREHPARYTPMENTIQVDGTNRIPLGELETGFGQTDALTEIKKLIWSKVFCNPNPPYPFNKDAEEILSYTLEVRNDDSHEHYYITIPANRYDTGGGNIALLSQLVGDLPYLGVFLIGAENSDQVLVMEEPRFVVLIQEFFRMLRQFS